MVPHSHHRNPYIRRSRSQDRDRRKHGMRTSGSRMPTINRAELARQLLQILNFI